MSPVSDGPAGRTPAASEADARRLTAELREALGGVRDAVVRLAVAVRDAHTARVWEPLGYSGWGAYAQAEFGVSRAQAYRLIDLAHTMTAISGTVTAAGAVAVSPVGDTGLWDPGLSQRALRDVHGRLDVLTATIGARLADAGRAGPLTAETVRDVVRQAVDELRRPAIEGEAVEEEDDVVPPPSYAGTAEAWAAAVREGRAAVEEIVAVAGAVGASALEIAPDHLTGREAAEHGLARFAADLGLETAAVLEARLYAMTGDRRVLDVWWS